MTAAIAPILTFDFRTEGPKNYHKFIPELRKALLGRLSVFGLRTAAKIKRSIKSWSGENSHPWAMAKDGTRVLYQTGFMQNQPSWRVIPGIGPVLASVEVGFIKDSPYKRANPSFTNPGRNLQKAVETLTGGAEWTPSQKQRQAFWAKVPNTVQSIGKQATYKIDGYDFMSKVAKDPQVLLWFHKYIAEATKKAMGTAGDK